MRVLKRTVEVMIILITAGFALMSFDSVRQYGVSLFASAGVAGLAVGLAAKPLLGNLIAGVQIALTQPIRIDDAVVVEGEWGWIEEFTSTYVVIRLWDWRRLVVPLGYFLENPFQNWTRTTSSIIGSAFFHLDHRTPVAALRNKLEKIVKASKNWDGQVVSLQVTDTTERTIEVRTLMSAHNSSKAFDLRCEVREQMLEFLQTEYPQALPRFRADVFSTHEPERSASR
jgi:small-conductance mechanosensitive channel